MAGKIQDSDTEMTSISEINVTPFVDVVLVLLVIFMVTAPMLVREQMNVNLPKAETGEKGAAEAILITVNKAGQVYIKERLTALDQIQGAVQALVIANPNTQAVISADQDAKHGDVVTVIDLIKRAGLTQFAIEIERR